MRLLYTRPLMAGVLAALAGTHAHAQGTSADSVRSRISREFRCRHTPYEVTARRPLSNSFGCSLARRAVNEIATGGARALGIAQEDTSRVTSVTVRSFAFAGLNETPAEYYWSVSIRLRGRSRPIVIGIDQMTGATTELAAIVETRRSARGRRPVSRARSRSRSPRGSGAAGRTPGGCAPCRGRQRCASWRSRHRRRRALCSPSGCPATRRPGRD